MHDGQSDTNISSTCGSANTVNVTVLGQREVVVDDTRDIYGMKRDVCDILLKSIPLLTSYSVLFFYASSGNETEYGSSLSALGLGLLFFQLRFFVVTVSTHIKDITITVISFVLLV